jgi:hypothetical protein
MNGISSIARECPGQILSGFKGRIERHDIPLCLDRSQSNDVIPVNKKMYLRDHSSLSSNCIGIEE